MAATQDQGIAQLLQRYERFGIDLGLDRILHLLQRIGNPHHRVPIVHVAGTNGKGSVCAYLSAVLNAAGYRVGRYTSPHLIDWQERIVLNEKPIPLATLLAALQQVEAAIDPNQPTPTQFEVLTAAAWCIFAEAAVDVAVVEVGLGGRLDATNVCENPLATVITSISREHWQRLGATLGEIAGEKAGILKANVPALIGPLPDEAMQVVQARANMLNCPTQWVVPAKRIPSPQEDDPWVVAQGIAYPLPLLGDMQLTNSALAIATLKTLRDQGWSISETAIQTGMAQTFWPGRLQWTEWSSTEHGNGQTVQLLIDGAHNSAAALALRQYLDEQPQPVHWLMGMLSTKDHRKIFEALLKPEDRLTLVPVTDHSSADPETLAKLALEVCPMLQSCSTASTLIEGLSQLAQTRQSSAYRVVLCGSLYLVGKFLSLNCAAIKH